MESLPKEIKSDLETIKKYLSEVSFGGTASELDAVVFALRLTSLQIRNALRTGNTL